MTCTQQREAAEEVIDTLRQAGNSGRVYQFDVADYEATAQAFEQMIDDALGTHHEKRSMLLKDASKFYSNQHRLFIKNNEGSLGDEEYFDRLKQLVFHRYERCQKQLTDKEYHALFGDVSPDDAVKLINGIE